MQNIILSFIFSVILLFYLVGQSIRIGLLPYWFKKYDTLTQIEYFILDVFLSLITTSILVSVLAYFHILYAITIMGSVYFLVILMAIATVKISRRDKSENELRIPVTWKELIPSLVILLSVSIIFMFIRSIKFPYPKSPGTDSFSHLAAINSIIYAHGTYNIVGSYSYVYHAIVASFSMVSGTDAIWCYNALIGFIYPFSLVITFFFFVTITRNAMISVLSIGGTLAVFEHGGLLATYYPFPSSFAYIFVFTIFSSSIILKSEKKAIILLLIAYSLAVISYIALAIASAPILVYLLEKGGYLPDRFNGISRMLFILIIGVVTSLFLMVYFVFPLLGYPDFEYSLFIFTIKNTIDIAILQFTLGYSFNQIFAIIGGIAVLIILRIRPKHKVFERLKDMDSELILLVTISYLLIFFAPIDAIYRTELFIRPLFILLMIIAAYSVFSTVEFLILRMKFRQIEFAMPYRKGTVIIILALVLLIPLNYEQISTQFTYLLYGEPANPDFDEMDIFRWVENHTKVGDYILTDMSTGYFMRGCIFRNASTSFVLNGMSVSPYSHVDLIQLVFQFMNCSEEEIVEAYSNLLDNTEIQEYTQGIVYIVITPRSSSWIYRARYRDQLSRYSPYRYELNPNDPAWTKWFSDKFTIVAEKNGAIVLTINF